VTIRLAPRLAAAEVAVGFGVTLRLAPVSPAAWRAALRDGQLRIADALAAGPVTRSAAAALMTRAVAEHFVIGWDGVLGEDGAPAPFGPAALAELLAYDPALHHAAALALDAHVAAAQTVADEGEASPPASNGAPAGASGTAPTAPRPPAAAAGPAPDGAEPTPAPRTSAP
jgi:hypothetical protein